MIRSQTGSPQDDQPRDDQLEGSPSPAELDRIRELLGRQPRGAFEIVARDHDGDPVVLRNAPLLDDGTPMPTRYWLVGPTESRRISQLESIGGVQAAELAVDPDELVAAHNRYAAERDAHLPPDYEGPTPSGGVGGTRRGVKCLHAHWAWHLVGGNDPVGAWIETQLATTAIALHPDDTVVTLGATMHFDIPWGYANLTRRWLSESDPPPPSGLTNALGAVDDYLDDIERQHPPFIDCQRLVVNGEAAAAIARLETGRDDCGSQVELTIGAAEEIFRLVATESGPQRRENPGLPADHADTIIASMCIVLSFMRRRRLSTVLLRGRVNRECYQCAGEDS